MVLQATRTLLLKNILCSQRFFKTFGLETHGRTLGHSGQYSRKLMIELQDIQDSTPGNLSNYFRKLRILLQETKDRTPGNSGQYYRKLRLVFQETQDRTPGNGLLINAGIAGRGRKPVSIVAAFTCFPSQLVCCCITSNLHLYLFTRYFCVCDIGCVHFARHSIR